MILDSSICIDSFRFSGKVPPHSAPNDNAQSFAFLVPRPRDGTNKFVMEWGGVDDIFDWWS